MGAGVIGMSLAWELAQRDHTVHVVESGEIGRGASWAGAGILPSAPTQAVIDPYDQLQSFSHELHPQWAARLAEETGVQTGYRRCGGIHLARSRAEMATLLASQMWWEEHGIEFEALSAQRLQSLEPELPTFGSDELRAWRLPNDCQLRNPWHLQALEVACRQRGVQFLSHSEIVDMTTRGDRVTSLATADGRQLRGERFCICSGAWARKTLDRLKVSNGILPIRGQMVLYHTPTPLLRHVVNEGHRYLVPRDDGYLLAGSIEEEVGFVSETTSQGIEQIANWAVDVLPKLASAEVVKTWAGLRPGSFDGLPYIGSVPGLNNLFIAAGHFRSGLHLSCGTAIVLANLIDGRPNDIDLHPFRVGRG